MTWETLALLLWLALPVIYIVVLGTRYVRRCRAELDRARSYVDNAYADIEDLLARHHEQVP